MAKKASISGLVVFFLGITLLIFTFVAAFIVLLNPSWIAEFGKLIPAPEGDWQGVLKAAGYAIAIGLLMVMVSIAGRVTAQGIKMFKAQPSSEPGMDV